jgi:hypothetical protein
MEIITRDSKNIKLHVTKDVTADDLQSGYDLIYNTHYNWEIIDEPISIDGAEVKADKIAYTASLDTVKALNEPECYVGKVRTSGIITVLREHCQDINSIDHNKYKIEFANNLINKSYEVECMVSTISQNALTFTFCKAKMK